MIELRQVEETCSCNNCHRPNYTPICGVYCRVDELVDLQIGNHVTTLCRDCLEQLRTVITLKEG